MSEIGLRLIAESFVVAARTLPKEGAEEVVYASLAKFEREVTLAAGREAKVIAEGMGALSGMLAGIVRTKGPLIPVLQALVALEDACRSDSSQIGTALATIDITRRLPRGHATETG